MVAGAVGNTIDRIFDGFVTDFLYFELINFPIFNVADIFVTVGGVILIVYIIFFADDEPADAEKSEKISEKSEENE